MESEADFTPEEDEVVPKKDVKKKKSKKKKKKRKVKIPKEMVMNENGEIVPAKEYVLEKTLKSTSKSLNSCQKRLESLTHENDTLQENLQEQEKDALQVIAALHKESEKKDGQIKELLIRLKKVEDDAHSQIENVKEGYETKIQDIMSTLNEKEAAFRIMQQEFAVIKDFRRKRNDLLKELEDAKAELADTEKRHKDVVTRLEKKFFNEKIRLQNEANQKIGDLATQAHKEAVANLKDTTKDVYKENIKMSEALLYHVQEGQELNRLNQELEAENRRLRHEAEMHSVIVKDKILHSKNQDLEIKQLKQSLQAMEHSLSHVVQEFEQERKIIKRVAQNELQQVKRVVEELTKRLATKTVEIRHIKRLAQHILDQRTDLEIFFMEALEHVKEEIKKQKQSELKVIQENYRKTMKEVLRPKAVIPPLKPLKPISKDHAAEILVREEASTVEKKNDKLDIKDLSWEDKEKILRVLFAKMNGVSLGTERQNSKELEELKEAKKAREGVAEILSKERFIHVETIQPAEIVEPISQSISHDSSIAV